MIAIVVLLVVVALVAFWIVGSFNRLVGMKNQALGRLIAVAENYPTLRFNENVRALMKS
ncbi:MAG TPA: hypothetical protein VKD69_13025 [Vicinamibacterales bacterium]|nr:hypothetical protein [Vicinamibacterales bacterium]